jgi:hypothetical protein
LMIPCFPLHAPSYHTTQEKNSCHVFLAFVVTYYHFFNN